MVIRLTMSYFHTGTRTIIGAKVHDRYRTHTLGNNPGSRLVIRLLNYEIKDFSAAGKMPFIARVVATMPLGSRPCKTSRTRVNASVLG